MALGSIKDARQVFQKHDFSRSWQVRILNMHNVPAYMTNQVITQLGSVYAKTLVIPGREITNIEVPYQGFPININGMAKYNPNPWSITFRTAGDYLVRSALEHWSFDTISDETSCGSGMPNINTSFDIAILNSKCDVMRVYTLYGVYPQSVGEISYNIEGNDVTEFTAAFQYQYWRVTNSNDSGKVDSNATAPSSTSSMLTP